MFDLDEFLAACTACLEESDPRRAVREVLTRAVSRPEEVGDRLEPKAAGITLLYHAPDLTVLDVVWAPGMRLFPHDHRMWATIGVYAGREDNEFFRRASEGPAGLVPSNGKTLDPSDVVLLGDDTIHSVANPGRGPTGAIHIYGGDFVNQPRSQWREPALDEEPFDYQLLTSTFDDANAAWAR
jgi:predicted metal-dependent enzyme (double-stranded beta helix superfamily)